MNQLPLISVIIPVFKVEPYLDRCLESVTGQSYPGLQIILVDDGSPDKCPAMCDAWAAGDSRIQVIHKPNGGLSDARNAGMRVAAGEYISFIDSDDWIEPEMLERLLNAMQKDESDIAACTVRMVWEDGSPDQLLTVQKNAVLDKNTAQKELLSERLLKQPVWYKLYRRKLIADIPFEIGKQHEDVFWSYQAVGRAGRVSLIDYIGYNYFQRGGSIMGSGYSLKNLDAMEAYEKRYRYLAEFFPELEKRARVGIHNACIYHGQMVLKYLPKQGREKAIEYLNSVKQKYPIRASDYANRKTTHRLWLGLSRVSLQGVCRLKNLLGVRL